ncbi:MAG: hypothetical protein HC902_05305 [Calothrix sp. SM1_5_4]|nr:hypothetical protein [Calothrix sp. SM1_5_4]
MILTAWLVARTLFRRTDWRIAYVLAVWWCGFYIARTHEHFTLLSSIWGLQALIWMGLNADLSDRRKTALFGALTGLVFCGTFHNLAMLSLPFALILGASLWAGRRRIDAVGFVAATALFALVFTAFFGPAVVGYFRDQLPSLSSDRALYNLDLLSLFVPHPDSRLYAWFSLRAPLAGERLNSVDAAILVLCLLTATKARAWRDHHIRLAGAIALLSWIFALGPEIRFNSVVLAGNPLDSVLASLPPFSLSRTPGRFAAVTVLSLTFIAFWALRQEYVRAPRGAAWFLIGWFIFSGPVMNRQITVPAVAYRAVFPMKALAEIHNSPFDDIVLHLPTALSSDPSQNFMQLFHGKRISSGYIAYTAQTPDVVAALAADPVLAQSDCDGEAFAFRGDGLLADPVRVREYLKRSKLNYVIINKRYLSMSRCARLLEWVRTLVREPGSKPWKKMRDSPC